MGVINLGQTQGVEGLYISTLSWECLGILQSELVDARKEKFGALCWNRYLCDQTADKRLPVSDGSIFSHVKRCRFSIDIQLTFFGV